jgi:hypothetical protein
MHSFSSLLLHKGGLPNFKKPSALQKCLAALFTSAGLPVDPWKLKAHRPQQQQQQQQQQCRAHNISQCLHEQTAPAPTVWQQQQQQHQWQQQQYKAPSSLQWVRQHVIWPQQLRRGTQSSKAPLCCSTRAFSSNSSSSNSSEPAPVQGFVRGNFTPDMFPPERIRWVAS